MGGATIGQIILLGPVNSLRLYRSTSVFYRMKDGIEKARAGNETEKVAGLEARKQAAKKSIERAAGKMCCSLAKRVRKGGDKKAAAEILASKKALVGGLTAMSESSQPNLIVEKIVATATLVAGAAGLMSGSYDFIKGALIGSVLTAIIGWQTFAEFIYNAADELLRKELTSGQSSPSARSS